MSCLHITIVHAFLKVKDPLSEDDYLTDNTIRIVWGLFVLNAVSHIYQFGAKGNSSDGAKLMKYLCKKCAQLWPLVFWQGRWDVKETRNMSLGLQEETVFCLSGTSREARRHASSFLPVATAAAPTGPHSQHKPPTSDQSEELVYSLTKTCVLRNHESRTIIYLKWFWIKSMLPK